MTAPNPTERTTNDHDVQQRGADLSRRVEAMGMTPDEVRSLINYLIGATPDNVEGALDHVQRVRVGRASADLEPDPEEQ